MISKDFTVKLVDDGRPALDRTQKIVIGLALGLRVLFFGVLLVFIAACI